MRPISAGLLKVGVDGGLDDESLLELLGLPFNLTQLRRVQKARTAYCLKTYSAKRLIRDPTEIYQAAATTDDERGCDASPGVFNVSPKWQVDPLRAENDGMPPPPIMPEITEGAQPNTLLRTARAVAIIGDCNALDACVNIAYDCVAGPVLWVGKMLSAERLLQCLAYKYSADLLEFDRPSDILDAGNHSEVLRRIADQFVWCRDAPDNIDELIAAGALTVIVDPSCTAANERLLHLVYSSNCKCVAIFQSAVSPTPELRKFWAALEPHALSFCHLADDVFHVTVGSRFRKFNVRQVKSSRQADKMDFTVRVDERGVVPC